MYFLHDKVLENETSYKGKEGYCILIILIIDVQNYCSTKHCKGLKIIFYKFTSFFLSLSLSQCCNFEKKKISEDIQINLCRVFPFSGILSLFNVFANLMVSNNYPSLVCLPVWDWMWMCLFARYNWRWPDPGRRGWRWRHQRQTTSTEINPRELTLVNCFSRVRLTKETTFHSCSGE